MPIVGDKVLSGDMLGAACCTGARTDRKATLWVLKVNTTRPVACCTGDDEVNIANVYWACLALKKRNRQ